MANPIGNPLSRLIRQRGYAGGELNTLDKQLEAATAALHEARFVCRNLRKSRQAIIKQMAELDVKITTQSAIRTEEIRAMRFVPKRFSCRHGSIVSELVKYLKEAGRAVTTHEIVDHMVGLFNLPVSTPQERRYARKWVTGKINLLARKGVVCRLHDPTDNLTGLWLWTGNYGGEKD